MARQNAYRQWLKEDLGTLVDALKLSDLQKHFLHSRWLDQIIWMEGKADSARSWYYRLRLTIIIGGVSIPALVSLNTPALMNLTINDRIASTVGWITFGLSLLVALSAAVEQFFNFGE